MRGLKHLSVALLGGTILAGGLSTPAEAFFFLDGDSLFIFDDEGTAHRRDAFNTMNVWTLYGYAGYGGGNVELDSAQRFDSDIEEFYGSKSLRVRLGFLDAWRSFDGVSPSVNLQLSGYSRSTEAEDPVINSGDQGIFAAGGEAALYVLKPHGLFGFFVSQNRQEEARFTNYGAVARLYTDLPWDYSLDFRVGGIDSNDDTDGYFFQVGATKFPTHDLMLGWDFGYNYLEGDQSPGFKTEMEYWYFGGAISYRIPGSPFSIGSHVAYSETEVKNDFTKFDEETLYWGFFFSYYLGAPPNRSYADINRFDAPSLHTATGNLMGKPIANESGLRTLGEQLFFSSDERLKRDVTLLARLSNGLGVYRYRYLWSDQIYVGVMAQEMLTIMPHAVRRFGNWFAVNYAAIWASDDIQDELREKGLINAH